MFGNEDLVLIVGRNSWIAGVETHAQRGDVRIQANCGRGKFCTARLLTKLRIGNGASMTARVGGTGTTSAGVTVGNAGSLSMAAGVGEGTRISSAWAVGDTWIVDDMGNGTVTGAVI